MCFTRYEIRWYSYEDNDFTYAPFDTLSQAKAYAKEHHHKSNEYIKCGIYKVKLYPNNESAELIERL